ncbi:reverse transcriptase domain-containing protein, partial [Tanacetum coccineum]
NGDFRRDYGFIATLDDEIMRDPERHVGYGITNIWDEMLVGMPGAPATDEIELGGSTAVKDHRVTGSRPQETDTVDKGPKIDKDTTNKAMIDQGVTAALAARDAIRSTNGKDSHNSGTGVRRNEQATHECTYPDFMKTVGNDIAYSMTWIELKKKMTNKYCPRTKIKKLEVELWNLKVKGTDVIGYNKCFQELALLCVRIFPEESDKIERYVGGLPHMIHGSVVAEA